MEQETASSISKGLLMAPSTAGYSNIIKQHKRAGSTGTTGDESYTTDEEDNNIETDEPDCSIKEHVTNKLFNDSFGSYSDIATITDKVRHVPVMHRNSSDSSVYSDLGLDKCDDIEWGRNVVELKEQTFSKLQSDLADAHQQLKLKDEEVNRLSRIRQEVETELEDLTASLFQEAHNMVRDANVKQAGAEKALKESQMKVEVLTAEVAALKTLVLTSTPSRPNPHLHPQIDPKARDEGVTFFSKKHRRCPSHFNLKYGRENSPPDSPERENNISTCAVPTSVNTNEEKDSLEVDPIIHAEFLKWKENPKMDKDNEFLKRIYSEDITLCLSFNNLELSEKVLTAVETGTIFIEAINDKTKTIFPKKCALLEVPRQCFYRMNVGEPNVWYAISRICRNRIISVCDFINYLKYIQQGLVKSSAHDVYWEITRLRKEMLLARLGLSVNS